MFISICLASCCVVVVTIILVVLLALGMTYLEDGPLKTILTLCVIILNKICLLSLIAVGVSIIANILTFGYTCVK